MMQTNPTKLMTMAASKGQDEPASADSQRAFVKPGGKVDLAAIRQAIRQAESSTSGVQTDDVDVVEQSNLSAVDKAENLPRVVFELKRELQTRLDKYLTSRIPFMSRTQLQKLIESGGVRVNDKPAKPSTRLFKGDRVEVIIEPPPDKELVAEHIPLEVLYEDDALIVLNKQPDIIVHPARSELSGTMINALAWHFAHESGGELSTVGSDFARPGVVHRLDRHTSGCIVFAKDDEVHWKLGHQFEKRQVDKRYLALVEGHVEPDVQVIDLPIGPHRSREKGYREKQVVRRDDLGKPSVTICRVRERYTHESDPATGRANAGRYSLVELELKTGRTHQIRVHMSYLGWPIVGDDMYGGRALEIGKDVGTISRQMLHAGLLAFTHPRTNEPMVMTAPLPDDMAELVAFLRTGKVESVHVEGTVPLGRFGL